MKRLGLLAVLVVLFSTAFALDNAPTTGDPPTSADSSDTLPPPSSDVPDDGFAVRCC